MSESFCVENVSYIYYSRENGSIPNGPKCHSCMNTTLHSGGLNNIDQVSIITTSGVVPFTIRSLICLYGMTSPFSIKDLAEVPLLMNCLQCCLNNSTRDAPANLASTDAGLVAQKVYEYAEKSHPHTEETANVTLAVESEDVYSTKKVKVEDDENSYVTHPANANIIDGECNPGSSHAELAQKAMEPTISDISVKDEPPSESLTSKYASYLSTILARVAERPVMAELQTPKTCRNSLVVQEVYECAKIDPPHTEVAANVTFAVGVTDLEAENLMDHSQRRKIPASEDVCATKKLKVEDDEDSHATHPTNANIIDGKCNPGPSHAELAHKAMESVIPEISVKEEPPRESLTSNDDPQSSIITARLRLAELLKARTCRNSLDSTARRQKKILDRLAYLLDSVDERNKGSKSQEFFGYKIHEQFRDSLDSKEFKLKVIDLIFDKVLQHPEHSKFYAHLCKIQVNSESDDVNKSDFSHLLIKHVEKIVGMRKSKDSKVQPAENEDDGSKQLQRRNLANVIFIGNMRNLGLVSEKIIEWCVLDLIKPVFAVIPEPPYNEYDFILVARMLFEIQEGKLSAEYRMQLHQYLKVVALKCSDKAQRFILMCIRDTLTLKRLGRKVAELERELFV